MATPEILDFATLLQPLSDSDPAGSEPQANAARREVRDARQAASDAEVACRRFAMLGDAEQGGPSPAPPDWETVHSRALTALSESGKDLWVAAWLIEALAREHGFAGLRDGFRLVRELAERFWDGIHPRPDEDDGYAHTVAQLTGLNGVEADGTLIAPILAIPLTNGRHERPLTSLDYLQATDSERRLSSNAVTLSVIEQDAAATSPEWYRTISEDLDQCLEEFAQLTTALDARCVPTAEDVPTAPHTSQIRKTLEECRDRLHSLAQGVLDSAAASGGEASDSAASGGAAGQAARGEAVPGRIATREDAFRTLRQVADYFRRAEPHSPVSYAVEQAVRWGQMTLPELIQELIADSNARQELFRRVGISQPESTGTDSSYS